MLKRQLVKNIGSIMLLLVCASLVQADYVYSYSLSGGGASANVEFKQLGTSQLQIKLSNTSTGLTYVPVNVLTAIFWDMSTPMTLAKVSAMTDPARILQKEYSNGYATVDPTSKALVDAGNVGSEFAYKYSSSGLGGLVAGSLRYGVSSSGLDVFGPHDRFDTGNNLEGPDSPDGIQYGLTTDGGLASNANGGLDHSLIKSTVTLMFNITAGAATSQSAFNNLFTNIRFQYGTALDEPHLGFGPGPAPSPVPAPAGALLVGICGAIMAAGSYFRRRQETKLA